MRSTMPDFPLTLQHFLWRSTTLFPRKEIVTRREVGRHRYTYADFGRRVAQLAHALRELGIAPGDRVGTLAWNNYRHLELYFAVPCSGAVLHTLNPRLFPEHLEFVINDAEDKVIFVDASIVPALQRVAKNLKGVKQFVVMADGPSPDGQLTPALSYEELIGGRPTHYGWPDLDERDAAAMCYTSGTTGKPKGVVYSHRSSVLHSFGIAIGGGIGLAESDSILPVVPMFHANAWGLAYGATMLGAKQVFPDRFLDPVSLTELIQEEKVTFSAGVPHQRRPAPHRRRGQRRSRGLCADRRPHQGPGEVRGRVHLLGGARFRHHGAPQSAGGGRHPRATPEVAGAAGRVRGGQARIQRGGRTGRDHPVPHAAGGEMVA